MFSSKLLLLRLSTNYIRGVVWIKNATFLSNSIYFYLSVVFMFEAIIHAIEMATEFTTHRHSTWTEQSSRKHCHSNVHLFISIIWHLTHNQTHVYSIYDHFHICFIVLQLPKIELCSLSLCDSIGTTFTSTLGTENYLSCMYAARLIFIVVGVVISHCT